jgi:uncharacterized protein (TIGR03437 family)
MNVRHCVILLLLVVSLGWSQSYSISTIAGMRAPVANNVPALGAYTGMPSAVLPDGKGNVYYTGLNCLFKITSNGTLIRVAGNGVGGYSGDGGPAINAQLNGANGLIFDASGNLYIADAGNYRIRIITPDGNIHTYLGNGFAGGAGDGGPASQATINQIRGLTIDSAGNIYFCDFANHVVRMINTSGIINTIAGTPGTSGYYGDSGPATLAQLNKPEGVALDPSGNIYIGDSGNNVVRIITAGVINTFAGITTNEGTTAPTTSTTPTGYVSTSSVGTPATAGFNGDGGLATGAVLSSPQCVLSDALGNIYICDYGNAAIRIVTTDGNINTFAGQGTDIGFLGDGGPALEAELAGVVAMNFDSVGNLYMADWGNSRIRVVNTQLNIVTVAGGGNPPSPSGDGGQATNALLGAPFGLAMDASGNLYFSDYDTYTVRKITPQGIISTVVGNGTPGYSGDGGPALSAQLYPAGLTFDSAGNLYIADYGNNVVREVNTKGIISTIAGNRNEGPGYSGDGGPAVAAQLTYPTTLVFDGSNNLYIADAGNWVIRMVNPAGNISTFAGNNTKGYTGDNGLATAAEFNYIFGLLVSGGNLMISDYGNYAVREISFTTGIVTTIVGNGTQGYTGDGPVVTGKSSTIQAGAQVISVTQLGGPYGILTDSSGQLFIADSSSSRVLKIGTGATPSISTVAGNGIFGYSGDGGPATLAMISNPLGLVSDANGNLYFADSQNAVIRKLTVLSPSGNAVTPVNAASYSGGAIAPGELVTLFSTGMGPAQLAGGSPAGSLWPTEAGNTQVLFNGALAPVLYSSNDQVAVAVPYQLAGETKATVQVLYNNQSISVFNTPVTTTAPGVFTRDQSGHGQAAALNQDTSLNSTLNPAHRGTVIVLYLTGEGQTMPFGVNGKIAPINGGKLPQPMQPVSVTIGGVTAVVQYAGAAPGSLAGLMQVNALIPDGVSTGAAVPVMVTVGTASSQSGVTIAVSN